MSHVVLLGDSVFDNAAYVPGGPSVVEHLRRCLPAGWRATLGAWDGAVVADVVRQLDALPADATHLIVSAGGNDALRGRGVLYEPAHSLEEVLDRLADLHDGFEERYRTMLARVRALGKPTAVCTIYEAIPGLPRGDAAGLCLFNDVILREAFRAAADVIDLRLICTDTADYSGLSPIEPSEVGGEKIARAVRRVVTGAESRGEGSRVFV